MNELDIRYQTDNDTNKKKKKNEDREQWSYTRKVFFDLPGIKLSIPPPPDKQQFSRAGNIKERNVEMPFQEIYIKQ